MIMLTNVNWEQKFIKNLVTNKIMKKHIILIILIFCFVMSSFSQNYYIGSAFGFHKDCFTVAHNNGKIHPSNFDLLNMFGNLHVAYQFKSNTELSLGVTYYKFELSPGIESGSGDVFYLSNAAINTVSLQFGVGYSIQLFNPLFLKINSGVDLDFYVNSDFGSGTEGNMGEFYLKEHFDYPINTPVNLLIQNRIALQYFTKSNIGFSLFLSYHSGLLNVFDQPWAEYSWIQNGVVSESLNTNYISNGSHWKIGFEIGYKFGKKK